MDTITNDRLTAILARRAVPGDGSLTEELHGVLLTRGQSISRDEANWLRDRVGILASVEPEGVILHRRSTTAQDVLDADQVAQGARYVAVTFGDPIEPSEGTRVSADRRAVERWARTAKGTGSCTSVGIILTRDPDGASISQTRDGERMVAFC